MSVYQINPLEDERWPSFVARHPHSSVFHTRNFLLALHATYGYEPVAYTAAPPAAPDLASTVVFCRITSWLTGSRLVSLPFADHCDPLFTSPQDGADLLSCVTSLTRREKWRYVEIRPLRVEAQSGSCLKHNATYCFHIIDLTPSYQNIFDNFHKDSIQRKIHRAEREHLRYETGRSEALLQNFYHLFLLTRRRHRLPPQPMEWFRNLVACLEDRLTIHMAFKDKREIASIITFDHGPTLMYKYGCSDAAYHSSGAMPFLFWKAIQAAKQRGAQRFDLGRSDRENSGLITFKDRLGATRSTLTYLRFSRRVGDRTAEAGRLLLAKHLFALIPDGLLTATGRLLYRHIG